jgi:hypothetical protein
MMRSVALIFLCALCAGAAHGQRAAVSADLSPEMAAEVFRRTVREVCLPAAAKGSVSAIAPARTGAVQPTNDPDMRRQASAALDDTVWEVAAARGVVTVSEGNKRCTVSVYGPPVAETILNTANDLAREDFKAAAGPWSASWQTLLRERDGQRISVQLSGSEPGAPEHQSRFPVITATVSLIE